MANPNRNPLYFLACVLAAIVILYVVWHFGFAPRGPAGPVVAP